MKLKIRYQYPALQFLWDGKLVMYIGKGFMGFCEPLVRIFGERFLFLVYFGHLGQWGTDRGFITIRRKPKLTGSREPFRSLPDYDKTFDWYPRDDDDEGDSQNESARE